MPARQLQRIISSRDRVEVDRDCIIEPTGLSAGEVGEDEEISEFATGGRTLDVLKQQQKRRRVCGNFPHGKGRALQRSAVQPTIPGFGCEMKSAFI